MKTTKTYEAKIYMGLKEGYDGPVHFTDEAKQVLQDYCDETFFAVSLTKTNFIYKNGNEPGVIVGLINYPRYPSSVKEIKLKAIEIAKLLMRQFNQERCSVVCSDETIMIEKEDLGEE